jgi:hypothetical protein
VGEGEGGQPTHPLALTVKPSKLNCGTAPVSMSVCGGGGEGEEAMRTLRRDRSPPRRKRPASSLARAGKHVLKRVTCTASAPHRFSTSLRNATRSPHPRNPAGCQAHHSAGKRRLTCRAAISAPGSEIGVAASQCAAVTSRGGTADWLVQHTQRAQLARARLCGGRRGVLQRVHTREPRRSPSRSLDDRHRRGNSLRQGGHGGRGGGGSAALVRSCVRATSGPPTRPWTHARSRPLARHAAACFIGALCSVQASAAPSHAPLRAPQARLAPITPWSAGAIGPAAHAGPVHAASTDAHHLVVTAPPAHDGRRSALQGRAVAASSAQ